MTWLYRYEAKSIQAFILATERLREMVGASAIVENLGADFEALVRETSARATRRMAAAGNSTWSFESREDLEKVASVWPMRVSRKAPGLQMIQAWAEVTGTDQEAFLALFKKLEAERNRPLVELPEAGPLMARAGRTGRPAVNRGGKGNSLRDRATTQKAFAESEVFEERLLRQSKRGFITDMDDFGDGYVAVIHADGNGIGQRLRETIAPNGPAAQQAFSQALTMATDRAAAIAVAELDRHVSTSDFGTSLPLRPLILGGDDFTVIVGAAYAIPFTDAYLRAFEAETAKASKPLGGGLTACAGIALVKPGFPFHQAHSLAEALCSHAKSAATKEKVSSFAFHRVTTASFESWAAIKASELEIRVDGQASDANRKAVPGALLGGPWTLHQGRSVEHLDALAVGLRCMPRGALREWLRVVRLDPSRGGALWRRLRDNVQREAFWTDVEAMLVKLGVEPTSGLQTDPLWTPVFDAVLLGSLGALERVGDAPKRETFLWRQA